MQRGERNEKIICRLFIRQICPRGNACPFNHPDYILNSDNASVTWLNFCQNFQKGRCNQEDCRYFHVTEDEENAYKLRKEVAPSLLEQAMRKALLFDISLTGTMGTCKGFLQGGCTLAICPYRHITRHEFANEVLNTLRNEFEIVLGTSGTDMPGLQQLSNPQANNRNSLQMNPMMQGTGQAPVLGNQNTRADPDEKKHKLEQENEEIYRALDPDQKANSLEEIRARLLTLQAALQWKDEGGDTNNGSFADNDLPPGMAVVNYDHSDTNRNETSIDLMRRRNTTPMQPDHGDHRLDRQDRSGSEVYCKLFVGGLDPSTTTETMKGYFSRFGDVCDAVVMRNPKKLDKSRGFGFVTYTMKYMADNAHNSGPHRIDGKIVELKPPKPRGEGDRGSSPKRSERSARSPDRNENKKLQNENRKAKLFVGGLSDDITTDILLSYFSRYGPIVDAVAMKDAKTKRPRGFGFVEFEDKESTDRTLADCPHKILGCSVTVDRPKPRDDSKQMDEPQGGSRRDDANTPRELCKMFVGGLNFATKENTVAEYFDRFGKVMDVTIQTNPAGGSKGYGFVLFSDAFMVDDVLKNGPHTIGGRQVDTGYASKRDKKREKKPRENVRERRRSPDYSSNKTEEVDECKIYVGKLTSSINEDDLEQHFLQYGDIKKIEIKTSQRGNKIYGFLSFEEPHMVDSALQDVPHEIDGISIDVGRAHLKVEKDEQSLKESDMHKGSSNRPRNNSDQKSSPNKSASDQPCKLFVGNLSPDITEEALYEYFCRFGEIKDTKINTNPRGSSKRFGFIHFADEYSVSDVLDEGTHEVDGCEVNVGSAYSRSQDKRGKDNSRDRRDSVSAQRKAEKKKAEKRSHLD